MQLQNLSDNTQRGCLAAVSRLAKHYQQSPDQLGGHIERCDSCGAVRITYHSCRNRSALGGPQMSAHATRTLV